MATTIQNIELPKKPRARDTSSSKQEISQELITEGDFGGGGAAWTAAAGWTASGGFGAWDTAASSSNRVHQTIDALIVGKDYKVTFTISNSTDGLQLVRLSGITNQDAVSYKYHPNGKHTVYFTSLYANTTFSVYGHASYSSFDIDDISLTQVESFNNNNHGEIYSGRGLEFDGVTDYLQVSTAIDIDVLEDTATITGWFNTTDVTAQQCIYNNGNGGDDRFGASVKNSRLVVNYYSDGSSAYVSVSTSVINPNTWYRFAGVLDGSGGIKIYLNGVLDSTATTDNAYRYSDFQTIGMTGFSTAGSNQAFFTGMICDIQVWDAMFTATDAAYDYANPESLALNASGSALTESNLKAWYPMQDGHRGQQSYILDGANTGAGDEMVSNGDFSDGTTGWTSPTQDGFVFNVVDGKLVVHTGTPLSGGGTNELTRFNAVGTLGVTYKLTVDVSDMIGTETVYFRLDGNQDSGVDRILVGNGSNNVIFTAYEDFTFLKIVGGSHSQGVTLDNISVKAINDKHHATTVFHGDELVTNGTFAGVANGTEVITLSGWTAYNSPTSRDVESEKLEIVASGSNQGAILSITTTVGRTYKLQYTATGDTGASGIYINGISGVNTSTETTYSFVAIATTTAIYFRAATNAAGTTYYDDISLKEVGVASGWTDADQQLHIPQTALQSYNELAWFDGTIASDAYVDLDSAITTSGNSWSLSFWVFHDDNGYDYDIILGDGSNQFITLNNNHSDKLSYRDSSNTYHTISDAAIPESEWVHITITATANASITSYVNGVAQATNSDMTNTTLLLERFMRGYSNANYLTLGTINEISYYSDVLTSAEALDLFNDGKAKSALEASGSAGLVGYWRNNGLSTWTDLKGSNNGTPTSVTETILIPQGVDSTRDAQGFLMNKKRSTGSLNASSMEDYVEISDNDTLDFGTGDFTIGCWARFGFENKGSTWNSIVSLGGTIVSTTSAGLATKSEKFYFNIGGTTTIGSTPTLVVGDWYHVVGTRTGTTMRLYIDSVVESSTATSSQTVTNTASKIIGEDGDASYNRAYEDAIDGVLIYNRALSLEEVQRNYKATKGSHGN